ncbi:hypothetical protein ACMD2_09978, partial [Ananas comosus]
SMFEAVFYRDALSIRLPERGSISTDSFSKIGHPRICKLLSDLGKFITACRFEQFCRMRYSRECSSCKSTKNETPEQSRILKEWRDRRLPNCNDAVRVRHRVIVRSDRCGKFALARIASTSAQDSKRIYRNKDGSSAVSMSKQGHPIRRRFPRRGRDLIPSSEVRAQQLLRPKVWSDFKLARTSADGRRVIILRSANNSRVREGRYCCRHTESAWSTAAISASAAGTLLLCSRPFIAAMKSLISLSLWAKSSLYWCRNHSCVLFLMTSLMDLLSSWLNCRSSFVTKVRNGARNIAMFRSLGGRIKAGKIGRQLETLKNFSIQIRICIVLAVAPYQLERIKMLLFFQIGSNGALLALNILKIINAQASSKPCKEVKLPISAMPEGCRYRKPTKSVRVDTATSNTDSPVPETRRMRRFNPETCSTRNFFKLLKVSVVATFSSETTLSPSMTIRQFMQRVVADRLSCPRGAAESVMTLNVESGHQIIQATVREATLKMCRQMPKTPHQRFGFVAGPVLVCDRFQICMQITLRTKEIGQLRSDCLANHLGRCRRFRCVKVAHDHSVEVRKMGKYRYGLIIGSNGILRLTCDRSLLYDVFHNSGCVEVAGCVDPHDEIKMLSVT